MAKKKTMWGEQFFYALIFDPQRMKEIYIQSRQVLDIQEAYILVRKLFAHSCLWITIKKDA